jgi:hypothetical protein
MGHESPFWCLKKPVGCRYREVKEPSPNTTASFAKNYFDINLPTTPRFSK